MSNLFHKLYGVLNFATFLRSLSFARHTSCHLAVIQASRVTDLARGFMRERIPATLNARIWTYD